jgi:MFS family permease
MSESTPTAPAGLTQRVVLLLATAVFINYVDRGNLATASPLLKDELGLSNSQIGILLSAFFWSYAPFQPIAGWLAQRFDVRHVLAAGLAVWAAATVLTGIAETFALLLVLRILLGIGESVAYPCICKLLAQRAPEHERGRANGSIAAGQALGPTFGTLVGGLVMARFGWRAAFVAFGLVSLVWLLPWFLVTRGGAVTGGLGAGRRPLPYLTILKNRSLWGASLGQFCSTYAYFFVLSWLPIFLVKAHGFSVTEMARIGAGVYAVHAASSALVGWVSDRWIIAGASPNRVRKTLLVAGLIGVAILMMVCANAGSTLAIVLLVATAAVFGTQTPNLFAISQTLGGARAAGQWMGVQNLIGNLSGVIAPLATGFVVDRTGGFFWAFTIAAGVALVGCLAFGVLIQRIEPVVWPEYPAGSAPGLGG